MSKRRREAEANEKPSKTNPTDSDSLEEKRAKVLSDDDELKNAGDSFMAGSPGGSEESRPQRGQSKKSESLSDLEERPELISQKSLDGDDSASDKGSVMEETNSHLYQDLLDAVLKMKDNNGRMICELFLKLPPRQQYPEYYRVIKEPIDLKMIYSQVKNNGYASMDEIERDLNLLVKNAHAFNEPGSQVYKDATAIKRTVVAKRLEIEHTLSGAKSSKRLRSKRSTSKMSFAINALLSESDDEEEDLLNDATQLLEEDEGNKKPDGDSEDPFLTLYNSVRIYSDYSGRILSEAFMRLPSKRAYPDYYEIIKNPIGLLRIGSNIRNNYYESLDVLVAEINQCFQNAKIFNETESMLYQDAVTLQDILKSEKSEVEKMCLSKGIPLTRAVNKKIPKTSEQTPSEEGDVETKETSVAGSKALSKKPGKKQSENEAFKKRMKDLYNAVEKYQDENGRLLSELFLELPSAALYPDYYEIITEPTCLHMIDKNIQEGKYQTEQQFLLDFEIMFENAKHYNEVGSQVHQDALTLDKVLKKKRKSLGRPLGQVESGVSPSVTTKQPPASNKQTTPTKSRSSSGRTYQAGASTDVKELCKELYNSVKDYTDNTGRYLCGIFQKLPSKADYPDYYALIKRPIDMTKISGKFHADQYSNLEECLQDFVLMFDNACKYNDPDSQVYKDSLVLLRELLATKLELLGDCELRVPDVPDLVQKMLEDLYNSIIHHQDDEGRCYSDSLLKLATVEEVNEAGEKRNILTLATIGKLIQKRYYKRLDKLQEDLYSFFENARTHRSDTEVYDDAVELQQFYVQQRDRVCKDGERFVSPAISQTKRHLQHELDEERKRKTREEASETVDVSNDEIGLTELNEVKIDDLEIAVGDFVHVEEEKGDRFIIGIEKMWSDKKEMKWIRGTWFYRPEQTLCDGSRKFIEKEVVRSDKKSAVKVNQIKGLCYVMHIKNYIRSKPHDFEDDDIYVCECSYNVSRKSFKKIKSWPGGHGHTMRYVPREQPLLLNRSPLDPSKAGNTGENNDEDLIMSLFQATEEKKSLQIEVPNSEGYINYEQFWTDSGCYKLGDTVFCQTDEGYSSIARIDKIWTDRSSMTYFCGTTFIKPDDTQHLPTHMFYDKEVFHVPVDDMHRMCDIERKCFVLPIREYMRCRPTDVPEEDVFLCESRYDEDDGGHYRKLKGLKRPTLSTSVYEEEFYFFEENLNLVKKPSPLLVKDLSELRRDDRIVSPTSFAGDGEASKSAKKRSRAQSGFLLFSTERRGVLRKQYPDYGFGDISRLVGTEWKNLSPMKREEWESRGNSQAANKVPITSPSSYFTTPGLVYDCLWQGCDYQYENLSELIIHVLESGGHLIKMDNGICPCVWKNCERLKRGMRPFNSFTKLIRHCREVHLKGPPRRVEIHERSKNYFPKNQAPVQLERPSPSPVSTNQNQGPGSNQAFVGVVPSPTPSQVLGGGLATVNINPSLLDQQFSNVMRMPTPGLAQNMMSLTSNFGGQGMSPLSAPSTANLQRSPSVMTGSAIPPTAVNQFTPMPSMAVNIAQQQFANTLQQFSSVYQQQQQQQSQLPQQLQQQDQLPPPFTPSMPPTIPPQQTQITQSRPQAPQLSQPTMFPIQRPQAMDTQTTDVQMNPLFHSPPPRQQKLLHSDAYLRYIEGLRDGTPHLSNWNPNKPDVTKLTPQQQSQLPVQWLGSAYNPHPSTVDALWALREHMLNDALKLAKFSHNTT